MECNLFRVERVDVMKIERIYATPTAGMTIAEVIIEAVEMSYKLGAPVEFLHTAYDGPFTIDSNRVLDWIMQMRDAQEESKSG